MFVQAGAIEVILEVKKASWDKGIVVKKGRITIKDGKLEVEKHTIREETIEWPKIKEIGI